MLDGHATDTIEGSSLSYHSNYIDIYSCCWGPKDDGKRFGKPGTLARKALRMGAERVNQYLCTILASLLFIRRQGRKPDSLNYIKVLVIGFWISLIGFTISLTVFEIVT